MRKIHCVLLLTLTLVAFTTPAVLVADCGKERWSVKTGTDPDAASVDMASPSSVTISAMCVWPAPGSPPKDARVAPYETTVWVVEGTLTGFKKEKDSDYHLVLSDAAGNTMIVEIPSSDCVGAGSPFATKIAAARAQFDSRYTATGSLKRVSVPVRVTGVGMFDFIHGQTGVASNGIELHPVLDSQFNPTPTGTGGAPTELIVDGGFESATTSGNSAPGWNGSTTVANHSVISVGGSFPHKGSAYASLGGQIGRASCRERV